MAQITIEIDIDANGDVRVTPNPARVRDGDTVRWHVNSNATGGGALEVTLPASPQSPFGNRERNDGAGVEAPRFCNVLEPNTNAIKWPDGTTRYRYKVKFTNSPAKVVEGELVRETTPSRTDCDALLAAVAEFLPTMLAKDQVVIGAAKITSDNCATMEFTCGGVTIQFAKAGKDSWVETVKNSHRTGAKIRVVYTRSGKVNVAKNIHDN